MCTWQVFVGVMVTMEIHVHMTSVCRCDGYNGNACAHDKCL